MRAGQELVHPVTGERIAFRRTAKDTGGERLELDDHWTRADHATPDHAHPGMQERWEVVRGRVRFRIGGAEWTARAGEVVVAPPGVPHRAWNVGGDPVDLRIRMTPALRWEDVVKRLFAPASGRSLAALPREFPRELAAVQPASSLDAWFPGWHYRERHERAVAGVAPEAVLPALVALRPRDLPLTRVLMGIRTLPAALLGAVGHGPRPGREVGAASLVEGMRRMGFVELARTGEELVVGAAGRFWRLGDGLQRLDGPAEFAAFARPGFARAAMSFRVCAGEDGTRLLTETRIAATDAPARRAFGRYWLVVRAGSGLIRREMLAAAGRGPA